MGEEYAYMVMDRCRGDLKFYINTKTGYCGNCTDSCLFFGNIKDQVEGMLRHYRTLPVRPVWLRTKELHRLCSRAMKLSLEPKNG